jgi:hypothetical protein
MLMRCAYVYMLTNERGNVLYTGSTEDLKGRLYFHKSRLIPGFTRKYNVHRLVYYEVHRECFDRPPSSYATDRGMWGAPNLELCLSAGIKKIGIQPKGKAKALVGRKTLRRLSNRRAGIEARIAHLKNKGLGRSRMKSDVGDLISGYRSALSCNLTLLVRDLRKQPAFAGVAST